MDNQSKTMPPHDKRQSIDINQDSVHTKIYRHADKLVAGFDNKYRGILDETYYMMPATNWVIRNAILINDKLSA